MSHLIPAKDLKAWYDGFASTLTLLASGEVPYTTTGIHFKKSCCFVGGFKVFLKGYDASNGGTRIELMKDYEKAQPFKILDLPISIPSNKVIIVTENHPNGLAVEIDWLEHPGPGRRDLLSTSATKEPQAAPISTVPEVFDNEHIVINTIVDCSFTIKEALPPSPTGSIDVDYNKTRVTLDSASVSQGSLVWKFKAKAAGITEIIVDMIPSLPKHGKMGLALVRTVYTIVASYPIGPIGPVSGPSAIEGDNVNASSETSNETLTFLGRVNEALNIVRKSTPEAEVVQVYATPLYWITTSTVDDPTELVSLFIMFRFNGGSATIKSRAYGEWDEPQFTADLPPIGKRDFKLDGLVDIYPAFQAMRNADYKAPLKDAKLFQVFEESSIPEQQPYYNFALRDGSIVQVGARDKHIIGPKTGDKKNVANGA